MEPEKRRFVRKRTDQLLYAEFGADNGSVLLNLSEDGCSFQSMAPVRAEEVRFSVSVGDGQKIEGEGRMVWSDPAQRIGGLRFVNPSVEFRVRVREWLEDTLVTADGELDMGAVEAKRRRQQAREEARIDSLLAGKAASAPEPTAGRHAVRNLAAEPEKAPARVVPAVGWPDEAPVHLGPSESRGSRRGLSTMALVAAVLLAMIGYHRELGHLVMSLGSRMAGDDQGVAADSKATQVVPDTPRAETQPTPTDDSQVSPSGAEVVPASTERAAAPVAPPEASLKRASAPQQVDMRDVPALWAGVENGDTHAEVALAMRYVVGNGVPQSCTQARVLLEAAAKRGSTEARQELNELPQAGCR